MANLRSGTRVRDAIEMADKVVSTVEATGVPSSITIALWTKGEAFGETNTAVALAAYERAITVARVSGNRFWEIVITSEVAALQARSGDPINALRSFRQMLHFWRRSTDLMFVSRGSRHLIGLSYRPWARVQRCRVLEGLHFRRSLPWIWCLVATCC